MALRPGKLPHELLAQLLARVPHRDSRVLVGPGIGRDAAVIELDGRVIVAKTDPITLTGRRLGWYAVNVNANDIACMGALPAWFMATALLPVGSPESLATEIFGELVDACDLFDIELIGGHTEVTPGIDRPILVGAMLGECSRAEVVTGEGVAAGDCVLMTKRIAVEGTGLLALDAADALGAGGMGPEAIEAAGRLLDDPGISIVTDARTVCSAAKPRLLHDPTEGGLSTALYELAEAAGATICVDLSAIPVLDSTSEVCRALDLDALGLLASGALLAVVSSEDEGPVTSALNDRRIECHRIGRIASGPPRVIMAGDASGGLLKRFARDEIARYFEGNSNIRTNDNTANNAEG